jgi:hypothetical protein
MQRSFAPLTSLAWTSEFCPSKESIEFTSAMYVLQAFLPKRLACHVRPEDLLLALQVMHCRQCRTRFLLLSITMKDDDDSKHQDNFGSLERNLNSSLAEGDLQVEAEK